MSPRIDPISDAEREWLDGRLAAARELALRYLPESGEEAVPSIETLDRIWAAWLDEDERDPDRINGVILAVGVAFGQRVIESEPALGWVIATDAHGSDIALYGLPGEGDVLVYPTDLVAKRLEGRQTGFLVGCHRMIVDNVAALRQSREARGPQGRKWWQRILGG